MNEGRKEGRMDGRMDGQRIGNLWVERGDMPVNE
jgi:hypothetical protein